MTVDPDRLVAAAGAAVVVMLALAAMPLASDLTHDDGRALAAVVPAPPPPPLDLTPLKRLAPFGRASGGTGDPASLGLALRGIVLARPASASVALIAAGAGPAHGYSVGAALPGGAVLDAVEADLVVLRVGGDLVTLGLPGAPRGGPPAAEATAAAAPPPDVAALTPPVHGDEQTLLGSLGARATAEGFRVGAAVPDEARRAGLEPGDLIERVGGQPVGDATRDRRLFDDAVVAGRMQVDVVRDGKRRSLTIALH